MANIALTLHCDRHCSYCFAKGLRQKLTAGDQHMSRETFERALGFLERSDIDQVRLLGGEPSAHPDFVWFVERSLERGLRVLVFSSGLMPREVLQMLAQAPAAQVAVLINVNAPEKRSPSETARQTACLKQLGERVVVGHTIDHPGRDLGFLLELMDDCQLSRTLRIGLAQPALDRSNTHLHPKAYPIAGRRIVELHRQAERYGVTLEFDCGFVPCMFPAGFLPAVGLDPEDICRRCGPVPDILPDGSAVPCYPLAPLARLEPALGGRAADLKSDLSTATKPYRTLGIYKQCASCEYRENLQCAGGCLAAAMQRLEHWPFTISIPENPTTSEKTKQIAVPVRYRPDTRATGTGATGSGPEEARWVIPYVDQPPAFWERLHDELGPCIREVYLPLPDGILGSGRPLQATDHLTDFLRHSPLPFSVLINPAVLPQPVDDVAPRVIEVLKRLHENHGLSGVTISNLPLGARIREALPGLTITGSVLLDICRPPQVLLLEGICDVIVPASRVMRDLTALQTLREAFGGRIRMLVNEGCLPGCPYRTQHFFEMCGSGSLPRSLCDEALRRHPWMRLTGAWVLPQHLHLYEGLYDELKLAGRVTLRDPARYRSVLKAYVLSQPLAPNEIGGGPASVLEPVPISEEFYQHTLQCGRRCHDCRVCRDYYEEHQQPPLPRSAVRSAGDRH